MKDNKKCELGNILSEYIIPIMQLLTNDLPQYNFKMKTTKCLNTSIMITFFLLGLKHGSKIIDKCDSSKTNDEKYYITRRDELINNLNDIFTIENGRYIYYILIANNELSDKNLNTKIFPGHVFIIEKNNNKYYLYQSYIKQYNLQEYKKLVSEFYITKKNLVSIINKIKYIIIKANTWDDKCVKYWKDFTLVDTNYMKNVIIKNNLNICIIKNEIQTCLENLNKYINQKLKEIKDIDTIYGDISKYELNVDNKNVLTSKEIKQNLIEIKRKITKYNNN